VSEHDSDIAHMADARAAHRTQLSPASRKVKTNPFSPSPNITFLWHNAISVNYFKNNLSGTRTTGRQVFFPRRGWLCPRGFFVLPQWKRGFRPKRLCLGRLYPNTVVTTVEVIGLEWTCIRSATWRMHVMALAAIRRQRLLIDTCWSKPMASAEAQFSKHNFPFATDPCLRVAPRRRCNGRRHAKKIAGIYQSEKWRHRMLCDVTDQAASKSLQCGSGTSDCRSAPRFSFRWQPATCVPRAF